MAKNYIIENGNDVDFYEELYKSLNDTSPETDEDLCLITNLPLTDNFIKLECNHKFNYIPLYNDILNHKKIFNRLERRILKSSEIRCPYCRNIQTALLPYHEMMGVNQVHGVNHFDESLEKVQKIDPSAYIPGKCADVSIYKDVSENGTTITKTMICSNPYVKLLNSDGKTYCGHHYYYALKKHAINEKLKLKEQAKLAKEQVKLLVKQAKEQAKLEKMQAKKTTSKKSKTTSENEIIHSENVGGCVEILKSGSRKGHPCGCKVKENGFCGRHLNS